MNNTAYLYEEFWEPEQQRPVRKRARAGKDTSQPSVKPQSKAAIIDQLVKSCEEEGAYDDTRDTEGASTPGSKAH
jgi:hypothetical protein